MRGRRLCQHVQAPRGGMVTTRVSRPVSDSGFGGQATVRYIRLRFRFYLGGVYSRAGGGRGAQHPTGLQRPSEGYFILNDPIIAGSLIPVSSFSVTVYSVVHGTGVCTIFPGASEF